LKVERVSYDVMTPSSARGILEAVFWHPGLKYIIDEIAVCAPIRYENIRRNEVNSKASKQTPYIAAAADRAQRAALVLKNVRYVVSAHFEMTDEAGERDNTGKFAEMLKRRLAKGQTFHTPYLGTREFPANLRLIDDDGGCAPASIKETRSLGLMLYDIEYDKSVGTDGREEVTAFRPTYFIAEMKNGIVDLRGVEVLR
jgi:CRISPR-associated protein Cas5d